MAGLGFAIPHPPARDFFSRGERGHVDLPRLRDGGVTCQVMAVFTVDEHKNEACAFTHRMLDLIEEAFSRNNGFRLATKAADIERAKAEGHVSGLLAIEGGEALGEENVGIQELRAFHARGVRLVGLTWNRANALGRGVRAEGSGGLTAFGRRVVAEMENLGMIVDASHLSDEALDELLEIVQRPVVASHSNSRELCPDLRNLDDARVERIAATGGLVAATLAGCFIEGKPEQVTLARFVDHVERLHHVAGADHVAVGSDFDGFTADMGLTLSSCAEMPAITTALAERGFAASDIAKIMGGNWLRVIRDVAG